MNFIRSYHDHLLVYRASKPAPLFRDFSFLALSWDNWALRVFHFGLNSSSGKKLLYIYVNNYLKYNLWQMNSHYCNRTVKVIVSQIKCLLHCSPSQGCFLHAVPLQDADNCFLKRIRVVSLASA